MRGAAKGDTMRRGAKKGRDASGDSRKKNNGTAARAVLEARRQTGMLVCAGLLVIASVVALIAPGWGIALGTFLGGGSEVKLVATTSDGAAPSSDDMSATLSMLQARAGALFERGVEVIESGDDAFAVRVPAAQSATTVASALAGQGNVEFVRFDAISDADALAQLQAGTTDVQLKEGSYTAFATSDDITDAHVVTSSGATSTTSTSSSTVYAIGVTLSPEAAQTLSDITEELSGSSGRIAIVVDGTAITAPTISSQISGRDLTFSGGFTQSEAHELAAKIAHGPLPVELRSATPTGLAAALGGHAILVTCALALVIVLVVGLASPRLFGRGGWVVGPSIVVALVVALGVLSLFARFDFVILDKPELAALDLTALAVFASCVAALHYYQAARAQGASVRKAQQEASRSGFGRIALVEALVCVLAFVVTFFVAGAVREFAYALIAGLIAELVLMLLFKIPLFYIFTAPDAEVSTSDSGASVDTPQKGRE